MSESDRRVMGGVLRAAGSSVTPSTLTLACPLQILGMVMVMVMVMVIELECSVLGE